MKRYLFSILLLICIISAASAALAPFPGSAEINLTARADTSITLEHIYSVQETVIPYNIWAFMVLLGLAFLTLSVILPDRGELITGLIALSFITLAWIQSAFIGYTEITTTTMGSNVLVVQPVTTIYASHWMPWLMAIIFFIAFGNVILALGNFMRRPVERYPRPDEMQ